MSNKYPGGFITKSPVAPSGPYQTSTAPGIWTLNQQVQYRKQNLWPTAGNVEPPTVIGQAYAGGFYAGQIGVSGVATHYIIVGPVASAQSTLQWKTTNTSTAGTSSVIDGPANSTAMNNADHPAAQFCEGLTVGGFTDWYMPAKNELEVCYYNLKPTTTSNNTSSGINANAVPARASNYTTSVPAQTSSSDFKNTGAEDFDITTYWASTQWVYSAVQGTVILFSNGQLNSTNKTNNYTNVRAIRRIAV